MLMHLSSRNLVQRVLRCGDLRVKDRVHWYSRTADLAGVPDRQDR